MLNHASVVSVGAGATITGTTLTWNVPTIAAGGADATLSYTVKVNADAIGVTIRNVATPDQSGDCTSEADCTTDHPVGAWTLKKSSDPAPGSNVDTGSTITYTLTATNTSSVDVTGAKAKDTLPTDVTLVTPLPAGFTDNGDGTLTWAIPDMPAGSDPVSVSYKVTVDDSAAGKALKNVVVPTTPGGVCTEASDCTTTHQVKQLIVKVANSCKWTRRTCRYSFSTKNRAQRVLVAGDGDLDDAGRDGGEGRHDPGGSDERDRSCGRASCSTPTALRSAGRDGGRLSRPTSRCSRAR